MNEVKVVSSGTKNYIFAIQDEQPINVPLVIFRKIFSYLGNNCLNNVRIVNRTWYKAYTEYCRLSKISQLKNLKQLCSFFAENLSDITIQKKDFVELKTDKIWVSIEPNFFALKEKMLNLLKNVDVIQLKKLEKLLKKNHEHDGDNFFELVKIYKQIDEVKLGNSSNKDTVYLNICYDLIEMGQNRRAREVIDQISCKIIKATFESISESFAREKEFDEALEFIKVISDYTDRNNAFMRISKRLMDEGLLFEAIKVAKLNPSHYREGDALEYITKELLNQDRLDESIEVAKQIPNQVKMDYTLVDLADHLIKKTRFDEALKVAKLISDETLRGQALENLSDQLVNADRFDQAAKVAKLIPNKNIRERVLENIPKQSCQIF